MRTKRCINNMEEEFNLKISYPRERQGCDICKIDRETEGFVGFLGHVLWVCGACMNKISPKSKVMRVKLRA